ncbi:MAG: hypothetical protein HY648_10860 [Acidobacteria bacterium]|nr:hypothetical protein [Acidobacteriota bacterium]
MFLPMAEARPSLIPLFFRHFLQWLLQAGRILNRLWLEMTGALFLGLGAFAIPAAVREWRAYQGGGSLTRLSSTILFIGMMLSFGVYSFWKSRRTR